MEVEVILLDHSKLWILAYAARTCTATVGNMDSELDSDVLGPVDKRLVLDKCLKLKGERDEFDIPHESILEHVKYTFEVKFSRSVLQQMSRHRVGVSPSIQSTRYSLKRLVKRSTPEDLKEMLQGSGDDRIDQLNLRHLEGIVELIQNEATKNDSTKYGLPEAFFTRGVYSFNARSLGHFLKLRTYKKAMREIRAIANDMFEVLPESHKEILEKYVWK